jgi:hypothetical protein
LLVWGGGLLVPGGGLLVWGWLLVEGGGGWELSPGGGWELWGVFTVCESLEGSAEVPLAGCWRRVRSLTASTISLVASGGLSL